MASSPDQSLPPRSDEARLADFRIKNLNASIAPSTLHTTPVSRHGVIRGLPKSRYDSLVQDNPHAALSYVDEVDGETITVGSAFELDQRLKESFNPATASRPVYGASSVHPDDVQLLHTFDLRSRDRSIIQLWQSLQNSKPFAAATSPYTAVPVWARSKPADSKAKAPEFEMDRVLRWASDLPAAPESTSPEPIPVISQSDMAPHSRDVQKPQRLPSKRSERDIRPPPAKVVVPATSAVPVTASEPSTVAEHKPLLELFEAELAKLVPDRETTPTVPQPNTSDVGPSAGLETTSKSPDGPSATATTIDPPAPHSADPETSVPIANNVATASPAELLTTTLSSLFTGLGNLAARVDESNPQIREQLSQAHSAGQEAAFSLLSRVIPEIQGRAAAAGVGTQPAHSSTTPTRPAAPKPAAPQTARQPATASSNSHRNRNYEAERILASRYICYDNLNFGGPRYRQYLVRWAGCGPADDVWYDEDNLRTSCQPLIDLYERTRTQTPMQAQDAAQLHRRTAGNRMMASIVPQEQNAIAGENATSPVSPVQTPASHSDPDPSQLQHVRTSGSPDDTSASAGRRAYAFDPSEIMAQRAPLPLGGESVAKAGATDEPPLRRARSLAFRNVPGAVLRSHGRLHGQALDVAADTLSSKAIPTLRRAATTIHRHVDSRARGYGDAAETLFNSFEASRGRYLPRRAATARCAYRNGEHRTDASPQSDKITRCAEDLVKMGYRRSEAEPVAAICDGDLSRALDQLEEDRKAWLWRSNNDTQTAPNDAAAGSMPGSWDVYRW